MLQAVHLRGETHITVRELRAALVYILFGIHFCRDYHDGTDTPPPYWDRAFSPESPGRQGEVLRELVRFDPAHEAHPRIDRYLRHGPSFDTTVGVLRYPETTLASARRQAYFEWTKEDVESLAREDPHALDLTQGRHFRRFRDLAIDKDGHDELCKKLCEGISRLESLPPQALDRLARISHQVASEGAEMFELPLAAQACYVFARRTRVRARRRTRQYVEHPKPHLGRVQRSKCSHIRVRSRDLVRNAG